MAARRYRVPCYTFAFLLLLASCGSGDGTSSGTIAPPDTDSAGVVESEPQSERLLVAVTTTILGDLVANVVGAAADLVVLLPVGADPHDYRASAAQVALLHDADLVVANGLGLEEGILDVLEAAEADGINLLEVGDLLDPLPFGGHDDEDDGGDHGDEDEGDHHGDEDDEDDADDRGDEDEGDHHGDEEDGDEDEGDHHGDEGEDHAHSGADPHFWMDPLRVAEAARLIAQALASLDASVDWMTRADAYASSIEELHEEIQAILAPIPHEDRELITNHDALGYFADRYGFEIIDTVIPGGATLAEPSSAELAALVDRIRETAAPAIFAETIEPTVLAEALAAEAGSGVEVVELYTGSLGEPGSGADTLIGMLRVDARRIADALAGAQ